MTIYSKTYGRAFAFLCAAAVLTILYSCASIGNPSGGPRDEDPPRLVKAHPMPESTGFSGNEIYLEFDELVNVKDAFTNVTVSPPGASTPKVIASGRRVIVTWSDPLSPDTTYTVDFGTAIEDVNENNPLGNFSITFSTGADIDSLRISGIALDAATLEPQQGMLVGVYRADAPDSAFKTLRFDRVTKTDDRGRFTLRGLKPIPYNIYALGDLNNDCRRDNPAELMAFYPFPVTPYTEQGVASDTIFNLLTGAVDTVVSRNRTVFLPNNILLSVFDEGYKPQYLVKYERPDSAKLQFIFNSRSASLPTLEILGHGNAANSSVLEHAAYNDTLTYWLTNSEIASSDTLRLALTYMRTGSTPNLVEGTDTLTFTKPKVKFQSKKKKTKKELEADSIAREKAKWLTLNMSPSGTVNVYTPIYIEAPEPLTSIRTSMMRLELKQDSLYTPLPFPDFVQDTTGKVRRYSIKYPWEYGNTYRLTIDSTAMTGISGRYNATLSNEFSIKKREDYASLTLRIIPDTIQGFVEVLNNNDAPVARERVINGIVRFPYLSPADYYARFITRPMPERLSQVADSIAPTMITEKDILEFHTGNYEAGLQPDEVYYYPKVLSLKRHDRSEQWDLNVVAVDMQKPEAIKKNKPQTRRPAVSKKKKGTNQQNADDEDEYFDVNSNPFDPNSKRRRSRLGATY
ncbi:MAG: Ig-like domain-containing protein [Prevotella sp.]|nr:Ig-like domain-containing protein [Prevotella sp.]MCM1074566.1 Ig-like domain-containing protein [Ruminococcus sp.]